MYNLNYSMINQVLQQFRYSGEVHADVTPRPELREGGRVVLVVQDGTILSCSILSGNGQKLYHKTEALYVASKLGILTWKLVSFTSPPVTSPKPAPPVEQPARINPTRMNSENLFIPLHLAATPAQIRMLSKLQRSIYLLSDGTRDHRQIATLLSRPLKDIEQAIQSLQMLGIIRRH